MHSEANVTLKLHYIELNLPLVSGKTLYNTIWMEITLSSKSLTLPFLPHKATASRHLYCVIAWFLEKCEWSTYSNKKQRSDVPLSVDTMEHSHELNHKSRRVKTGTLNR